MDKGKTFTLSTDYPGIARFYYLGIQVDIPNELSGIEYRAAWDTGATVTCISKRIADYLRLPIDGYTQANTAGGTILAQVVTVDVRFSNGLIFKSIPVCVAELLNYDVLIGVDIISKGDFLVQNQNGKTTVKFGVPKLDI